MWSARETEALRKLLRSTPCEFSFKDLIRALSAPDSAIRPGAPAGAPPAAQSLSGDIFGDGGEDSPTKIAARRGAPRLGVNVSGLDVVTWRDTKRPQMKEAHHGRAPGQYHASNGMNTSGGVRDAMTRAGQGGQWSSASQSSHQRGLGGGAVLGTTSNEARQLRDSVYSAIRKLDSAQFTEQEFVQKLASLGVDIPPTLQRLIAKHKCDGSAVFQDFVRALAPFFEKVEKEIAVQRYASQVMTAPPNTRSSSPPPVELNQYAHGGHTRKAATGRGPQASLSHGDIVSWSEEPNALERRNEVAARQRSLGAKAGKGASPHLRTNPGIISWEGRQQEVPLHSQVRHVNPTQTTSGDIISWFGKPAVEEPPPQVGRAGHAAGRKLFGGSVPFGTETDLAPGMTYRDDNAMHVSRSRKAGVGTHRGDTGTWFKKVENNTNSRRPRDAVPFGTDADL